MAMNKVLTQKEKEIFNNLWLAKVHLRNALSLVQEDQELPHSWFEEIYTSRTSVDLAIENLFGEDEESS